jgi:hypothetical protein
VAYAASAKKGRSVLRPYKGIGVEEMIAAGNGDQVQERPRKIGAAFSSVRYELGY